MRTIARSLEGRRDTVVLFELPDTMRVLRECAFWDIYYEHCSYFTPGSLARCFRSSGFDVLALELDYDGQYILIEARIGGRAEVVHGLEERPDDVLDAANAFRRELETVRERWRREVRALDQQGGRTVIWGAGSKGVAFLTTLGLGPEIGYAVDINPYKQGMFMAGTAHEIVAPEFLATYNPDLVVAMNPVYVDEIRAKLDALGVDARVMAV
jgi:hypothetical protein